MLDVISFSVLCGVIFFTVCWWIEIKKRENKIDDGAHTGGLKK